MRFFATARNVKCASQVRAHCCFQCCECVNYSHCSDRIERRNLRFFATARNVKCANQVRAHCCFQCCECVNYSHCSDRIERCNLRFFATARNVKCANQVRAHCCCQCCECVNYSHSHDHIERCNLKLFVISSLRCELSPTYTLKWPGHNGMQIRSNTSGARYMGRCIFFSFILSAGTVK